MIRTTQDLLLELSDYGTPKTRIQRMVKNGALVKIRRGLYETNPNVPAYLLAGVVYSPSYISFSYALSHYGLIPKRVEIYTSATFAKNRNKMFQTPFGNFTYRDIPKAAYPYGALQDMLFDDLRIDEDAFAQLQTETLLDLTELYHTQNIQMLARLVTRERRNL